MKKTKKLSGRIKADRGHIPLTSGQKEILIEFYSVTPTRVLFTKAERNSIWSKFKKKREFPSSLNIQQKCPALADRAGLRSTRLHDLRHLHATELLRLGEPLHVVSDRLGHKDPMVTATIYAHVSNEQGESASNTFANASRKSI